MNILHRLSTAVLVAAALAVAACGDDDNGTPEGPAETEATQDAGLAAIKGYLLEHTARLVDDTAEIRAGAFGLRYPPGASATAFGTPP